MGAESPTASSHDVDPAVLKRAIGASAMGNAVEWFDYGVYAYAAVHIAAAMFPEGEDALAFTLLGFAVSFIMRPLGGMVWGPLGDRIGRKRVLALTIIMMAAATFCVGLIPPYAAIGIFAPILLFTLRIIQGFSTGGEYGGAATFMAEYAPDNRRGFFGSFLEFGTLAGFSAGALIMLFIESTMPQQMVADWGWRIPFFIAGPLGLIGMYLRSKMEDSPVFRELEEQGHAQDDEPAMAKLRDLCTRFGPVTLRLMGMVLALNVVNYTLLSYMPSYLKDTIHLDGTASLIVPIVGQLAMMAVLPFVGALSDRVGRKPMWIGSLVALAVLAIPMYHLMSLGFWPAMLAFAILGLLYTPQLATISATFPAMFPTYVRYAGVALGYNVSTALFGGTAPLVNEALITSTGDGMWPAYWMTGACVIGLIAAFGLVETKGQSIRGTEIPGTVEARKEQATMGN